MIEYYNAEENRNFLYGLLPKGLQEGVIVDVQPHFVDEVVVVGGE